MFDANESREILQQPYQLVHLLLTEEEENDWMKEWSGQPKNYLPEQNQKEILYQC